MRPVAPAGTAAAGPIPTKPCGAGGQEDAVLVEQPPVHRVAGEDVFGDGELHEALGRDDRHPTGGDVVRIERKAAHAAPMVDMGV